MITRKNSLSGAPLALALALAAFASACTAASGGSSTDQSGQLTSAGSPAASGSSSGASKVPDPPVCRSVALGDGASCVDFTTLKMSASAACTGTGEVFANMTIGPSCPGGALSAEVRCCTSPPKPVCVGKVLGDGTACLVPASVGPNAAAACAAEGAQVSSIYFGAAAGCDLGNIAKVLCCPAAPASPPAPDKPGTPPSK